MPILFVAIIILGLLFLAVSHAKKEAASDNWVHFYSRGREVGFSFKEIELLRQLTAKCGFDAPCSVFESQEQLERCIHFLVRSIKMSGGRSDRETQAFLSRLYDYRKKVEMNKPHIKTGMTNSRQVDEGQTLRILVAGVGVFKSQVVKNTGQYMTITRPVNEKNPSAMKTWTGTQIAVYFSKEGDAGYVFDSEVQDEVFSLGISSLKISQGEALFRTQKRKSVRLKMHKSAFLYLLQSDDPPFKLETHPGLKCLLEDISDTGCAVTVGGRANPGARVKIQFELENAPICITGTIRSTNFHMDENRSMLHIEAEPMPTNVRNRILGEVFGMMPEEDEDDLPFRVLETETPGYVPGGDGDGGTASSVSTDAAASMTTSASADADALTDAAAADQATADMDGGLGDMGLFGDEDEAVLQEIGGS